MIKNLRLTGKILLLAVLIPITAILIAGIGLNQTGKLKYEYDNLYGFMLIPITNIDQAANHLIMLSDDIHQHAASGVSDQDKTTLTVAVQDEDTKVTAVVTRYNQEWVTTASSEFTATLKQLGKMALQTEEGNALTQFDTAHTAFLKNRDALLAGQSVASKDIDKNLADMKTALDTLVSVNMEFAGLSNTSAQAAITQMTWALITAGVVASLVALGLALWLIQLVVRPIARLTQITGKLAQGELDVKMTVDSRDEIGQMMVSFNLLVDYLRSMAGIADQIGSGDLSVQVTPKSERDIFGNAFRKMVITLHELIRQVSESANGVGAASAQLASAANQAGQATSQISITIQQVSRGITQEAEAITHTTGSIEQMSRAIDGVAKGAQEQAQAAQKASGVTGQISAAIQQVAQNAQAVTQEAGRAAVAAQDGAGKVRLTLQGMDSIRARVGQSAEKVAEMGQHSEKITLIVETIEDIASQTNLLALNAAIEAARAGEQGKGFAVVADEVRKLAERASASTKEIGGLIRGIQRTVNEAIQTMQEGSREVENGVLQANEAGAALERIIKSTEAVTQQAEEAAAAAQQMSASAGELVASVDSVSAVVEENTAATEEMAAGSSEVTQAIENIASVSEENSAAVEQVSASTEEMSAQVEEVSASAESLAEMAQALQQIARQFKLRGKTQDDLFLEIDTFKKAHFDLVKKAETMQCGGEIIHVNTIPTHTDCAFGRWYQGVGKLEFGQYQEFSAIDAHHKKFHELLVEYVETSKNFGVARSQPVLDQLQSTSAIVGTSLERLKKVI